MQSSVRLSQPRPARLPVSTSETMSWPEPREPERITARFGTASHLPVFERSRRWPPLQAPGRWPYPEPSGAKPHAPLGRAVRSRL